jgi:hypothetical protein
MPDGVRFARVFAAGERAPVPGDPGQSWLTDSGERDRVTGYLRSGAPILMTTALQPDRLDPERGKAVGASYRTDGTWVWSDALTYYVRVHDLAPEDEFYQHIRQNGYTCPAPDDAAQDRALAALYASLRT